jgi:penicillin-binding protein 2
VIAPLQERLAPRRRPIRFVVFGLAALIGITVLTGRLAYMQLVNGDQFSQNTDQGNIVQQAVPSTRGLIYDRSGRLLVNNVPSFVVKIRPADVSVSQRAAVVTRLSGLLGISSTDINTAIDANPGSRFDLVQIANDVPETTARLISEETCTPSDQQTDPQSSPACNLPGVQVVVESHRDYLAGSLFSQILGYTGLINQDQLKNLASKGYLPDDSIGETGVEASYESALRGTYGIENVQRNAAGETVQVLNTVKAPQAGDSLQLTIDTTQQKYAEQALQWGLSTAHITSGVVIVMNPQDGEILAMVSLPTYDDNAFATGISNAEYQKLLTQPGRPLVNIAVGDQFPPGSTYKLVTGSAGLGDGKITANTLIDTKPFLTIGPYRFNEWNGAGWGPINITEALGQSSDTYFYQLAAMVGIDRMAYWAKQFGFGAPTGIDLPGEVSGTVPSNQWKEDNLGAPIFPGETYLAGIGQGYDAVTPIELINAYTALANGGTLYKPQVVRDVIGPSGNVVRPFTPEVLHKVDVSPDILKIIRAGTRETVTIRHTYNLVDMPIKIAAKTGTAQFGVPDAQGRLPYHTWFVGYTPGDPYNGNFDSTDSKLMVLAFADDSRTIGNAATEIAKYYLQLHYGIKKDYRLPQLLVRGNFYGN